MDPFQERMVQWSDALPRDFDFYHLGKVQGVPLEATPQSQGLLDRTLSPDFLAELADKNIIAFHFYGSTRAVLTFLFSKGLDVSTYSEVGNILASQLAARLSNNSGMDLLISPPQQLLPNQLEKLNQQAPHQIRKTYLHVDGTHIIPLEVLLFPFVQEDVGYA